MLHRSVGNNDAVFLFKICLLVSSLVDGLFQQGAVFRMNPAPEQCKRWLLAIRVDTENSEMLARPFNLAACQIPMPTACMTQFLAFLKKQFASPLFLVTQRIVNRQGNLFRNQREVSNFVGRIGPE